MRVIGTAGHVDHGKSTLVTALTGINPDRLKEEQVREMTIELGFAWLTLPHGETVSIVDVPGHEAFIKNMLAGVGGIDVALMVIAADEGIMPQTREHLAILDLLKIKSSVVALSKTDLALEPGWLDLIREEIRATKSDAIANAEIVPVSAKTGRGLEELKSALERALARSTEKSDRGRPRLPIDRVFSMSGFGTVVTGTLSDGKFEVGEDVEIAPRGLKARIRGLQSHKEKISTALPGGRVAINFAGVATDQMERGETVIHAGTYIPTSMIDAHVEWLESAPKPLTHNQEVELFVFSSQTLGRVRLLDTDKVLPGGTAWAQLVLDKPLVVARGDRFILRYASPSLTVGGGSVVDPHPRRRHKRKDAEVITQLERNEHGRPEELVEQFIELNALVQSVRLVNETELDRKSVDDALRELIESNGVIVLVSEHDEFLLTRGAWSRWRARIIGELSAYHASFPLRGGMPREELRSRVNLPTAAFDPMISRLIIDEEVSANEKLVWLPTHKVKWSADDEAKVNAVMQAFEHSPYAPPSVSEVEAALGPEILNSLVEQERLERVNQQILLTPKAAMEMKEWVMSKVALTGEVTAAELRDHFSTSRKYAIAFLEYLDNERITRRVGDAHVLR